MSHGMLLLAFSPPDYITRFKGAAPLLLCDATHLAGWCPSAGGPADAAQKFAAQAVQDDVPVSARHARQVQPDAAERDRGPYLEISQSKKKEA